MKAKFVELLKMVEESTYDDVDTLCKAHRTTKALVKTLFPEYVKDLEALNPYPNSINLQAIRHTRGNLIAILGGIIAECEIKESTTTKPNDEKKFNIYVKTTFDEYNLFNIVRQDLDALLEAYNDGEESYVIEGKKYSLVNLSVIKIFELKDPSKWDSFLNRVDILPVLKILPFGDQVICEPSVLIKAGSDLTKEFIGNRMFGWRKGRPKAKGTTTNKKKIFIVHGHNEVMKEAVARTISDVGLEPIILHEQPNKGRTIIEKFTAESSDVSFAIVLLSADDFGYEKNELPQKARPRARQNVVLELGFFIGKLGRNSVVALHEEITEFEIPSDYHGVIFTPYDKSGAWKLGLGKELKAAGIDVDLNKLAK